MNDAWKLYVMGCRGSWPVSGAGFEEFGGATTCFILRRGSYGLVLDCGTGLTMARPVLAGCDRVDVLLTHIHYDHLMGLLDFSVFPRGARRRFFAQFPIWFGEKTLARFMGPPFWPYTPDFGEMIPVESPGRVELEEGVVAHFYPSYHPDDASILRIDTEDGSVCAAFDYEHAGPFPLEVARGCEILLYDAMYTRQEYETHKGYGHSCWEEGCKVAREAGVGRLVITHHNPERDDQALRAVEEEAQKVMPGIRFARGGDVYQLKGKAGDGK